MYLNESIPGVQGPHHEIALVKRAVSHYAVGLLGLPSGDGAMLIASRANPGSYISERMYRYNVDQIRNNPQIQDELNEAYEDLDLDAHTYGLTASTLPKLARLPRYKSYSRILDLILRSAASDWDITFPELRDFDRLPPLKETGTTIEFHPY